MAAAAALACHADNGADLPADSVDSADLPFEASADCQAPLIDPEMNARNLSGAQVIRMAEENGVRANDCLTLEPLAGGPFDKEDGGAYVALALFDRSRPGEPLSDEMEGLLNNHLAPVVVDNSDGSFEGGFDLASPGSWSTVQVVGGVELTTVVDLDELTDGASADFQYFVGGLASTPNVFYAHVPAPLNGLELSVASMPESENGPLGELEVIDGRPVLALDEL